ncbi:uncharacterized protein LOC133189645 [Saccostrea echinata]|uniref:uncharacterized protein LOC133189645 n=1 Tax=Saccostrea echinata TaxID=191078 RepID=UPI002A824707|nr:uncharacterized protein LOC133189645 [Saccostrea echinata]
MPYELSTNQQLVREAEFPHKFPHRTTFATQAAVQYHYYSEYVTKPEVTIRVKYDGYQNMKCKIHPLIPDIRNPSTLHEATTAICDDKTDRSGACTKYYSNDGILKRNHPIVRDSGGSCSSPEKCTNCNNGFYGDGPYCKICPPIANCNHRRCTSPGDNICVYCEGEVLEKDYYRAYTPVPSQKKKCEKACSWRSDSTRCFPGTCTDGLASQCKCSPGFEGHHCEQLVTKASIMENECKLEDPRGRILANPADLNEGPPQPTRWTNNVIWVRAVTKWDALLQLPAAPPVISGLDHYVTDFRYGIKFASTKLRQFRAGRKIVELTHICEGVSERAPKTTSFSCKKTFYNLGRSLQDLKHDDQLIFYLQATTGGYVKVKNREANNKIQYHPLVGRTTEREFTYHWDLEKPYHNLVKGVDNPPFLSVPDLTENPKVDMTWGGWIDDLSGLEKYQYEVYELGHDGKLLGEQQGKMIKSPTDLALNVTGESFDLPAPGMYSIHFSAFDKAGNHKTGRKVLLYDNISEVTTNPSKVTRVTTATKETSYVWVTKDTRYVDIMWRDRFRNSRHENNRWLNSVASTTGVESKYDDHYGERQSKEIPNVHALVDFKVAYNVTDTVSTVDSQGFTSVSSIFKQGDQLNLPWTDGNKLDVTVRAIDVLGKYLDESVTVYRDASPPHIEDLWLTRGDRLNVSVHRIEDFKEMTIEWIAYDHHSGLNNIAWRLFDNFTGLDVLHGHEDIPAQGMANDTEECESKYGSYPRGANCYETPFWGAYHKHFQVKPAIKSNGGLVDGKHKGVHDSDYYLEVTATNKAMLTTVLSKKITIDTSPPHTGMVEDGIPGGDEVDYQQSKTLTAHWEGFFDRESGVLFYQYGYDTKPLSASAFSLEASGNGQIFETYSMHATHTVTTEGQYYICVVAYNRALEPSEPVCSDGVMVTTAVPSVQEVNIEGATVTGGLVTDSKDFWIVTSNRFRRLIKDPTPDCTAKATVLPDLDLLPAEHHDNGTFVTVNGSVFCANSTGSPDKLSPMLSKSSRLFLSWLPVANPGSVHDYEVGFSSTAGSPAPDIMAFKSTKQHPHIHVYHTDVPDGSEFYTVIKTISKANVEGTQSIGPCFMDTTPPVFTGPISVRHSNGFLTAAWGAGAFSDAQEPYQLKLEFAIGHLPRQTDVQSYIPLQSGGSCVVGNPPTCTAIAVSDTEWRLHGHQTYYVTIKAENSGGLSTYAVSDPYIHDVQLATKGVVFDIQASNLGQMPFTDIEDVDFMTTKGSLTAHWEGFSHPHLNVTYKFQAGTTPGGADVVPSLDVGSMDSYSATGLSLQNFKTYYVTITAVTLSGSVTVTSDGVTVVQEGAVLSGIDINDGELCIMTVDNGTLFKHHYEDNRKRCENDTDFQASTNTLQAYWQVPTDMEFYTPDAHFAIEEMLLGNLWNTLREYEHIRKHNEAKVTNLDLKPGRTYRMAVKLCAITTCYDPLYSDGVMILANPPNKGKITVEHQNTTQSAGLKEKIIVNMDRFYDPDVQDQVDKYDVIDKYEWAITDNSHVGRTHTVWSEVTGITVTQAGKGMQFEVELEGQFDFSKCRRFAVRGYNKAKLFSSVSADIKDCEAFDPILIKPKHVLDAVGQPEADRDGYGQAIFLEKNARWPVADKDYTPNMNYLSAVWPQLRYRSYVVAVLNARTVDATTYYQQTNALTLSDPCSHPDAIKCSTVDGREFVNFKFNPGELVHGQRYIICIHTVYTEIKFEEWTQVLPELNTCSDGVVVDLTPPTPGKVWIGNIPGMRYQTSTTDMYINWQTFEDVEEISAISHSTGIQDYQLGIGTTIGGNDVVAFHSVGVVNHAVLHGLYLQSGHTYYATVKAMDYAGRVTTVTSDPVVVDTSTPQKSDAAITITGRHFVSNSEIEACWKKVFVDPESTIDHYMWAIGSEPGYDDVMDFTREESECGENSPLNPLDLKEGHAYYITVKAINKAGLMSSATSWAYSVDLSPPVAGHIYDGVPGSNHSDIDFQTDMSSLNVYWEGFHDPHSAIKEYYVSVGTCPACSDVIGRQALGIVNSFKLDHVHFGAGLIYYTSLTACNTAELCTTVMTDGVMMDNSPPSMGLVMDGTRDQDTEYQSIRTYIGAKWHGFVDPQSGLDHYVWWAGTTPGGNDILPEKDVHLATTGVVFNLSPELPIGKRVYVTVRAYNKAGLFTDSTSNGFLVDTTAPVISMGPRFASDFSLVSDTQFYRTLMKVEWSVNDPESHIERQYLSVKSHIGGEFDLASTKVNGIARDFILTGMKLHDGVTYYVTLISCNGAQICSSATTSGLMVDTTPPSRGMFAVETDHAANLTRHSDGWMTWEKTAVNLAWLGFADLHSKISYYYINVGSVFMGNDMNEEPGQPVRVEYVNSGEDKYDEGIVQTSKVKTSSYDASQKYFYISMWAVNKVGLSSSIIHSQFEKIPGGDLYLIRRCEAVTCEGHCVCAPQDKVCHPPQTACQDISSNNQNNILQVYDVAGSGTSDVDYTPSNVVLQGQWAVVNNFGNPPKWYQWSVGYTEKSSPEGIFNQATERIWHDAGRNMKQIFQTKNGIFLKETVKYSFFLKVWYDENTYAVFKSDGVTIATRKPAVTNIRGSAVREKMLGSNFVDQDFMKGGFPFTVEWNNKFLDAENAIKTFHLYISTYPGGHDILDTSEDLQGTQTSYNVMRSSVLLPGITYYSNVQAYGYSDIHHTESSDGFKPDKTKPITGIVFDGIGLHDLEFQNKSDLVAAHWHGFSDIGSGVQLYYWCVGSTPDVVNKHKDVECGYQSWEAVGLHTSVSRTLGIPLNHSKTYYNKVYAVDNVGYKSSVVVSDGVTIDLTPPEPQYLFHTGSNILTNPSFEMSPNVLQSEDVNTTDICNVTVDYQPSSWNLSSPGCAAVVSSNKNLARDGRSFLFVRGSVTQRLNELVVGGLYRVNFYSSHLSISSSTQSNKEGYIQMGDKRHVFLIYTKPYRGDGNEKLSAREEVSWHKHTFYFIAMGKSADLQVGSVDEKTGIFVDHMTVEHVERDSKNGTSGLHVQAHVVYLHEWGSVHGSWSFVEDVSSITEYQWAIGYTRGGTQLQNFQSVGLSNFAFNSQVTLTHDSYIYITAIAQNSAGLQDVSYSDKILVDLTPPRIEEVLDGDLLGEDLDAWKENTVYVNWKVTDDESGLEYCEWAIGYQPKGIEVQSFEKIKIDDRKAYKDFDPSLLQGKTVYSTIQCQNKAGLLFSLSSNGVTIFDQPPSMASAVIQTRPLSVTEYPAMDYYQSIDNSLRIVWSGVVDKIGVQQYKISVNSNKYNLDGEGLSFSDAQDVLFASVRNVDLGQGQTNVTLQAINKLLERSIPLHYNLTVVTDKPMKDASKQLSLTWHDGNKEFVVSWDGIFTSSHPLRFEVSAGTALGGGNIIQWQETRATSITFGLPESVTGTSRLKVYMIVRAITAGGDYSDILGTITLPA